MGADVLRLLTDVADSPPPPPQNLRLYSPFPAAAPPHRTASQPPPQKITVEARQRRDKETEAIDEVLLGIFPPPPWLQDEPEPPAAPRSKSVPTHRSPDSSLGPPPSKPPLPSLPSPRTRTTHFTELHVRAKEPIDAWHTDSVVTHDGQAEARLVGPRRIRPPLRRPRHDGTLSLQYRSC